MHDGIRCDAADELDPVADAERRDAGCQLVAERTGTPNSEVCPGMTSDGFQEQEQSLLWHEPPEEADDDPRRATGCRFGAVVRSVGRVPHSRPTSRVGPETRVVDAQRDDPSAARESLRLHD